MNFNDILNGVLKSVGNTANQSKSDLGSLLGSVLNTAKSSAQEIKQGNTDTIAKVGGGAALVGILSMVLGRNGGANLTKLGSLAALGSLAYKAYQDYQKNKPNEATDIAANAFEDDSSEEKGAIILRTMLAAAVSDGALDENEEALILKEGGNDPELQQWLLNEMHEPASVEEIAQVVGNDTALASQVYLAARLVCQDLSRKEIVFLSQLAEALKLDEALVEQLEKQAGF
ncbi:tellurite resistance TerB family protein [Glaesserella sp.]|uniref:tellurite resistance TerB family protein n=1 Tax=Glaesserella sp. TaxID=2094731 RepID=UPI0035A0522E